MTPFSACGRLGRACALGLVLGVVPTAVSCSRLPAEQAAVADGGAAAALEQSVNRMMAETALQASTGFTVRTILAPGSLSDPLSLIPRGTGVWVNDGGREDGERGGEVFEVHPDGTSARLFDTGRTRPLAGLGVAPPGYGGGGGHIFTLIQPREGALGTQADHLLLRRPAPQADAITVCAVPTRGALDPAVPGGGLNLTFGPPEGPFANRLFVAVSALGIVFEVQPSGACEPFVTVTSSGWERPLAMAFNSAGNRLLLGAQRTGGTAPRGVILQIDPTGTIERDLAVDGVEPIWAIATAPALFAGHAGELFFTAGDPPRDLVGQVSNGTLYRITPSRAPAVVVAGFLRPTGLAFVGDSVWVADARGRRVTGQRLPDGVIVAVRPEAVTTPAQGLE